MLLHLGTFGHFYLYLVYPIAIQSCIEFSAAATVLRNGEPVELLDRVSCSRSTEGMNFRAVVVHDLFALIDSARMDDPSSSPTASTICLSFFGSPARSSLRVSIELPQMPVHLSARLRLLCLMNS